MLCTITEIICLPKVLPKASYSLPKAALQLALLLQLRSLLQSIHESNRSIALLHRVIERGHLARPIGSLACL